MPVYDYLCAKCGPFTETRPMAESDRPLACPECGKKAPRAFLKAPYFATASQDRAAKDTAGRRNTRSHSGGCSCCSGKSMRYKR
jgi:putative FmdB family regulatory protein